VIDFSVLNLDNAIEIDPEPRGKKSKVWVLIPNGQHAGIWLFKIGRLNTLEDVTEVLAAHLASMIDLPCAKYLLANRHGVRGVASKLLGSETQGPKLGNELLFETLPISYSRNRVRKNTAHTLSAIRSALKGVGVPANLGLLVPSGFGGFECFLGYLMFDAWIANQDRHHENWGVLIRQNGIELSPSFDHAAALASSLTDAERQDRLRTKDKGYRVSAFAAKARSAIYEDIPQGSLKTLGTHQVFRLASVEAKSASLFWLDKLRKVNLAQFEQELAACASNLLSQTAREFTVELLNANRASLLEVELSP
jgi:hypothetical protein